MPCDFTYSILEKAKLEGTEIISVVARGCRERKGIGCRRGRREFFWLFEMLCIGVVVTDLNTTHQTLVL